MGEATVRAMVREGAQVVLSDLNTTKGSALADELGDNVIYLKHNVTDMEGWGKVVKQAESSFGPVNILVNNAGIFIGDTLFDRTIEDYRKLIEVNQIAPFL